MVARSRISIAKREIEDALDSTGEHCFGGRELAELLAEHREEWRLPDSLGPAQFKSYLIEKSHLEEVRLQASEYPRTIVRYTWRDCSPLELACSLGPNAYLSHGTAVFLHALNDEVPQTFFVNREQSPKPGGTPLTQEAINRTFAKNQRQRQSRLVFTYENRQIVVLSGKHTANAGVMEMNDPYGGRVRVTSIERTLIDIAVRPAYAGGVDLVLQAYQGALERASIATLIPLLRRIGHAYPYHQAIGYYAEKAGFPADQLERLARMGLNFNFYVDYGIKSPAFVEKWRLFVPKHLEN